MQQVTEPTAPSLEKKLIHCFENVAGEFIVEEVEGFEQDVSRLKLFQSSGLVNDPLLQWLDFDRNHFPV